MAQQASLQGGVQKRSRTVFSASLTFVRGTDAGEEVFFSEKPYDELNVDDLLQLAKVRGMKNFWQLRREALLGLHAQYDLAHPRPSTQKPPRRPSNQITQVPANPTEGKPPTRKKGTPPGAPTNGAKDDPVPDPTPSDQPDAGIAQIPFADLEHIVLLAKAKDIDFDEALQRARQWKRTNRIAFSDSADIVLVETRANEAISQIGAMREDALRAKLERERAQAVKDQTPPPATPVVAAVDPPPPPPPPMVTATAAATPPTPPRRSWEWLYAIAAVLGAAIIGACIIFGLQALDDDDDDNGGNPASDINVLGGINSDGGLTDEEINILLAECSEDIRDKCREILENVSTNEELHAAINQIAMMEKNLVGNNGGNPAASASVSDLGKVLTSTGSGGGPNLDGIYTGSCEASQVGNDKIMFRSGKLGVCTEKVDTSKLDGSWQMVVDSVYHEVNGNSCTGCTQGFNLSSLPSTFTVTIKNGAAVIGSPSVASARYCTAKTEGLAYGHFNVEHLLPLPGMDAACK